MTVLPVDASKFAGMSEEQARTFPRRTVVQHRTHHGRITQQLPPVLDKAVRSQATCWFVRSAAW